MTFCSEILYVLYSSIDPSSLKDMSFLLKNKVFNDFLDIAELIKCFSIKLAPKQYLLSLKNKKNVRALGGFPYLKIIFSSVP